MMLTGKGYWMKVTKPTENYNKDGQEWAFDVTLDEANKQAYLKAGGFKGYIKNKDDERGDFLSFNRPTKNRDGGATPPFRIVDDQGKPWDNNVLIGNGSEVRVKYLLNEVGVGRNKGKLKPSALAIQVWDHKAYGGDDEFETREGGAEREDSPFDMGEDGEVA